MSSTITQRRARARWLGDNGLRLGVLVCANGDLVLSSCDGAGDVNHIRLSRDDLARVLAAVPPAGDEAGADE